MVNISPCHGEDRRFESGRGRQMNKNPENKANGQPNDSGDSFATFIKGIEDWLHRKRTLEEFLNELEERFEEEQQAKDLEGAINEFTSAHEEFMKDYNPKISQLARNLSSPLINLLDEIDKDFEDKKIDVKTIHKTYRDITFKVMDIAIKLAKDSPGMNPPGEKSLFTYDPLEISIVFVYLMAKRLGDKTKLAPIGWMMFIDGLVGSPFTVDEQVKSSTEYLDQFSA